MKIVVYNPHWYDRTAGIHDYIVEFLKAYRPTIQLSSTSEMLNWTKFLIKKQLPLFGWQYVFSEKSLNNFDAWICFAGSNKSIDVKIPVHFSGLKVYHLMDYVYRPEIANDILTKGKVDYLLGYARHDQYCRMFRDVYPSFVNRVIPWPFGYSQRFKSQIPFDQRTNKCSIMGAVNLVSPSFENTDVIAKYVQAYKGFIWAHPLRQMIRENIKELDPWVKSYLPGSGERVNLTYNSPDELNKFTLFINDESVMGFPPARTYEGCACGAVMLAKAHPCYNDFGFINGENCFLHSMNNTTEIKTALQQAVNHPDLPKIQKQSLLHIDKFSHKAMGHSFNNILKYLQIGNADDAMAFFRQK